MLTTYDTEGKKIRHGIRLYPPYNDMSAEHVRFINMGLLHICVLD